MLDETKIAPAISAEEWREGRFWFAGSAARIDDGGIRVAGYLITKDELPKLIALANAALPDSDPLKITREMLGDLRLAAGRLVRAGDHLGVDLAGHADALASYLPPEG